jgi:hypothetical protein
MRTTFRHKVFATAHEIRRATGKAFPVCLTMAWGYTD